MNVSDNLNFDNNVAEIDTELSKYGVIVKENSRYMMNNQ